MNKSINVVFIREMIEMYRTKATIRMTLIALLLIIMLIGSYANVSADYSGDDDNDGIGNDLDKCYNDDETWTSNFSTDFDADGCKDSTDDWDDDNDDVSDEDDSCPKSIIKDWKTYQKDTTGKYIDFDHDGCLDTEEDDDDDDDGIEDSNDQCLYTALGATIDNTGCEISFEDDDGDGISNSYDQCDQTPQNSVVYWNGCLLENELEDSDNDGVINDYDLCHEGRNNWQSNASSDHDGDGCQDDTEDWDDDNDGVGDNADDCNKGHLHWSTYMMNPVLDFDHDGCQDDIEDDDDDDDGFLDTNDQCPKTRLGAGTDTTGCENSFEDDDEDGVANSVDYCENTDNNYDVDFSGCPIWTDDDEDGIPNWDDLCPNTVLSDDDEIDQNGCIVGDSSDNGSNNNSSVINDGDDNSSEIQNDDQTNSPTDGTESIDDNWWSEIPVIGSIVDDFYSKYGLYIAPTVFGLGVIGYAYRAATLRSDITMAKRVKKFKKKISDADSERELRKIQVDIEQADDKRLLPRGALGDLLSLIELRAEDLGLTDFISPESIESAISSAEIEDGVNALNEAKEELRAAVSEIKSTRKAGKTRVRKTGKRPEQDGKKYTLKGTGKASISRPSYHPKDINRDGVVDEEDERIWSEMSDEERAARSTSPFGGNSDVTAQIIAFSKLPASPNSICHCGKNKKYGKCCMKKDLCPCGSGEKFYNCCAKEKGYR